MGALWNRFEALDREVTERYGKAPDWWRARLDCRGCPTSAQVDEALRNPRPTPSPAAEDEAADSALSEENEGWEDFED
jgi:hypothetical protein